MTVNGMTRPAVSALALVFTTGACADWDNPTALADLQPATQFEVEVARVETFEEVEIHVEVTESGGTLSLTEAELEIEPAAGGAPQTVAMEPEGNGYAAHVHFFQSGEHHLHLHAVPQQHHLMREMGEDDVEVHRQHQIIGPYWVELGLTGPVDEGQEAHIHFLPFDLLSDGTPGDPATGLAMEVEAHHPDGDETPLTVAEEQPAEYEVQFTFGGAGLYEFHVGIEVGAATEEGEFHVPVLTPEAEAPDTGGEGGHTHGS